MSSKNQFKILVFFTAFCCLMFELIVSRVADFHLDFRNSYLAIPITFLGLALGSLHAHFRPQIIERFNSRRTLIALAGVSALTLFAVFLIFGRFQPVIGSPNSEGIWRSAYAKIPLFILAFSIPFYFFGRILTISYHINRENIGGIYSADFFGAALACFITPFCFHYLYLPGVVFVFLLVTSLLLLLFLRMSPLRTLALALVLVGLNFGMYRLIGYLDNTNNFSVFLKRGDEVGQEVAHAWNEFSRVTLAKFTNPKNGAASFDILHDNAVSNVHVRPFRPGYFPKASRIDQYQLPFLMLPKVDDVLVMFAGCGAEMISFYEYSGGQANITGIEINPLVMELARDAADLKDYHLDEFYALPNVHLRIKEGRSFLQSDQNKYDTIFVGSKAATIIRLSGFTRKYLDTEDAYELYLRHLKPGGLLIFDHQPIQRTLESLRWVFKKMNLPPLDKSMIMINSGFGRDLVIAPDGFTPEAIDKLMALDKQAPAIAYAPYRKEVNDAYAAIVKTAPMDSAPRTTDDRPYESEIQFAGYKLFPSAAQQKDGMYFMTWSKITTLLFVCALAVLLMALAYVKSDRLPPATLVYLLLTGFCYLLVEVIFIAKLELFMQDPLISMATVLSIFLLTSGLGSFLFPRVASKISMRYFPFVVALLVLGSIYSLGFINQHLFALPMPARIAVAAIVIAPVSLCLGIFYPYAIAGLVSKGHDKSVPVTYAISTLSSVIGATYAMTMVINLGFNNLLMQAAIGYVVLGIFAVIYGFIARRNVLALN